MIIFTLMLVYVFGMVIYSIKQRRDLNNPAMQTAEKQQARALREDIVAETVGKVLGMLFVLVLILLFGPVAMLFGGDAVGAVVIVGIMLIAWIVWVAAWTGSIREAYKRRSSNDPDDHFLHHTFFYDNCTSPAQHREWTTPAATNEAASNVTSNANLYAYERALIRLVTPLIVKWRKP